MLGDGDSGKTALMKRYDEGDKFLETKMATLGINLVSKVLTPKNSTKELTVEIFDTAGQERFRTLTAAFSKQANGAVVVFNVTSEQSFRNLKKWIELIQDHARADFFTVLVGHNVEGADVRAVTTQQAQVFADLHNLRYFEVSARNSQIGEIEQIFMSLVGEIFANTNN